MSKKVIFISIFVLVLIGILSYFYFFKEVKSQNTDLTYTPITIFAVDSKDNKIVTGYKISGTVPRQGQTSKIGDILDKGPVNTTVNVESYNLEGQTYYTYVSPSFLLVQNQSVRVKMTLFKPEKLNVTSVGFLSSDKVVNIFLTSKYYRNPGFCIKWSTNILHVNTIYNLIDNPTEYINYDKCFELNSTLEGSQTIPLIIDTFGPVDNKDFLEIVIFDRDLIDSRYVSSINNKDIGGTNIVYRITS